MKRGSFYKYNVGDVVRIIEHSRNGDRTLTGVITKAGNSSFVLLDERGVAKEVLANAEEVQCTNIHIRLMGDILHELADIS